MEWPGRQVLDAAQQRLSASCRAIVSPRIPLHRQEPWEPFFIVGAPRSGNTLLRRMIMAAPGVHVPPETFVLKRLIRKFRRLSHAPWEQLVYQALATIEYHPLFASTFGIPLQPLASRLLSTPRTQRSLAFILDAFYRHHAACVGQACRRWGDKTPLYCFAMKEIRQVFPQARFVHVLRDGVDASASMIQAGIEPTWEAAANRWVRSVQAVRDFARRYPGLCHEIRYERLVVEPEPVLRGVCSFLGLEYEYSMVERHDHVQAMGDVPVGTHHANVAKPVFVGSVGKGRRELTHDQGPKLGLILDPTLVREGYAPASSRLDDRPGPSASDSVHGASA